MTLRIKELEWEDIWRGACKAVGLHKYIIQKHVKFWLDIDNIPDPDRPPYLFLEEAKAAAQAHHEQELMKWLEKDND